MEVTNKQFFRQYFCKVFMTRVISCSLQGDIKGNY